MPSLFPDAPQSGLDTSFLDCLVGYNARRAALSVIDVFMDRMKEFELTVVDFSVLSLIAHNHGATSRQLAMRLPSCRPTSLACSPHWKNVR